MSSFSQQTIGEWPVYPGHPLTIGLVIMHRFQSLEAATAATPFGWPAALGEGDVDGAGGEVYQALQLLRDIETMSVPLEDAPAVARERWFESGAGGHTGRLTPGQEQADRLAKGFLQKARSWLPAS